LILLPLLAVSAVLLVILDARCVSKLRPLVRLVLGGRVTAVLEKLYWSLYDFRNHPGAVLRSCGVTAASFMVRIFFVKVTAAALSIEVSFVALLITLPLTWVALMLPVSVGGLGLQETAYLFVLT